ncbi:MAG: lipoprotein signal peptidase [Leptospiraceae bacterium]|nr:MAG: lipoprotein signal peptidase [Leptospiraceae bacterium]
MKNNNRFDTIKSIFQFNKKFLEIYPVWWLAILSVLVFLDLITKKWMTDHLNFHLSYSQLEYIKNYKLNALIDGIPYIPVLGKDGEYIKFRLVFNDRFIFGSGPSAPVLGIYLTFFAILFLFIYRWKNDEFGNSFIWLLIFSGAIGNFIDKLFVKSVETREWVFSLGPKPGHVSGVVDFVECIWFGWEKFENIPILSFLSWQTWPTFNLADSLIVIGITFLFLLMLKESWTELKQNQNKKE